MNEYLQLMIETDSNPKEPMTQKNTPPTRDYIGIANEFSTYLQSVIEDNKRLTKARDSNHATDVLLYQVRLMRKYVDYIQELSQDILDAPEPAEIEIDHKWIVAMSEKLLRDIDALSAADFVEPGYLPVVGEWVCVRNVPLPHDYIGIYTETTGDYATVDRETGPYRGSEFYCSPDNLRRATNTEVAKALNLKKGDVVRLWRDGIHDNQYTGQECKVIEPDFDGDTFTLAIGRIGLGWANPSDVHLVSRAAEKTRTPYISRFISKFRKKRMYRPTEDNVQNIATAVTAGVLVILGLILGSIIVLGCLKMFGMLAIEMPIP